MRLDFNTFVITGPSTETASTAKILNGAVHQTGVEANQASTCATDVFTITNAENLPEMCGTLTGEHGKYTNATSISISNSVELKFLINRKDFQNYSRNLDCSLL